MDRQPIMEKNWQKWHKDAPRPLMDTDPELADARDRLIYGEIMEGGTLTDKQKAIVALASLAASQGLDNLAAACQGALNVGVSAAEIHETIYQAAPYMGYPRAEAALKIINPALVASGVKLPLEKQGTVTEETRLKDGLNAQVDIFGDRINAMRANAPTGQKEIVANYLTAWCFGDTYTRKVLDLKMRELITFSAIVSLGGCDSQAQSHAAANISVGNTKQNLIDALAVMVPLIGFPRTLNGLAAVNAAVPEK